MTAIDFFHLFLGNSKPSQPKPAIARDALKLLLCIFVHFKAGRELLPVRSGATKLRVLKVLKVECRARKK
jgi:hypothetical protein